MPRPPVDSRLQNIEKSQQKIEGMIQEFIEKQLNSKNPTNDVTPDDEIKSINCDCEKVAAGPESTQQKTKENSGESTNENK